MSSHGIPAESLHNVGSSGGYQWVLNDHGDELESGVYTQQDARVV